MKLELKHLTPYFPYALKVLTNERTRKEKAVITALNYGIDQDLVMLQGSTEDFDFFEDKLKNVKPILRPLSDMSDYFQLLIEENEIIADILDEEYLSQRDLDIEEIDIYNSTVYPYDLICLLAEHHFDLFELIDKGLAIDINTLP